MFLKFLFLSSNWEFYGKSSNSNMYLTFLFAMQIHEIFYIFAHRIPEFISVPFHCSFQGNFMLVIILFSCFVNLAAINALERKIMSCCCFLIFSAVPAV